MSYVWSSTYSVWQVQSVTTAPTGDFFATRSVTTMLGPSALPIPFDVVITGNAGGWYNPSNGRFTPPAGRYRMFAAMSGAGASVQLGISIRKNGVVTLTSGVVSTTAAWTSEAVFDGLFDANGTDYFEVYAVGNGVSISAGLAWFGAFPISGVKGPQGDAPAGSLMLYSEQVLAAPAATISVSVPANAKMIKLQTFWLMTPAADIMIGLRGTRSGTPDATAIYNTLRHYGAAAATSATDVSVSTTSWLQGSGSQGWGEYTFILPASPIVAHRGMFQGGTITNAGVRVVYNNSHDASFSPANIDGYQLICASTNFAAGSWLRCWAAT